MEYIDHFRYHVILSRFRQIASTVYRNKDVGWTDFILQQARWLVSEIAGVESNQNIHIHKKKNLSNS